MGVNRVDQWRRLVDDTDLSAFRDFSSVSHSTNSTQLAELTEADSPSTGMLSMQHHWWFAFGLATLVWLGSGQTDGWAQEAEENPPASAADVVKPQPPPESLIYLPYAQLKSVFEQHGSAVFLPFQDYLKLWEQAWSRPFRAPAQPPVGGVISKAAYVGKIEQDQARITATFDVQVLNEGWVEIPVAFGDAAISAVTAEPGPVLLRGTGNGTYALLFSKSGTHAVTLELAARVRTAPEGRSFELKIPTVGITTFELTVPEADQTIELKPKLLQQGVGDDPQVSRIRASLGSTDLVSVRWHPRVGTKPDMELLASAFNATAISIEDGLIHADAHFQLEVLRGQIEQLRVAVPKGQRVLDVASSAGVKEWTIAEEADRQVLTVQFLSRQSGKVPLEVHTEWTLTGEPFDVFGLSGNAAYGIHLLDVLRENGQLAIRTANDLQLNIMTQQGLARIDESEVDSRLKKRGASYFRFFTPQGRLTAVAKPVEPRLVVDHTADVIILPNQLALQTHLKYTIERAGTFSLTIGLPEGMTIENVTSDHFKQYDVSDEGRTLTISLLEGRQGELNVRLLLVKPRDPQAQTEEFPLPLVEPRGVEVETGKLRVLAHSTLEVISDAAGVVGFQTDPQPRTEAARGAALVSGWTFNRRPLALPLRTMLKPTRLTASLSTGVDVQQGQVKVMTQIDFQVEFAGLDTFRFSVPEAVADSLQIHLGEGNAPPIRQRSRGEAVDGWVPWTIVLQRDATGTVPLRLTYDLKPAGAGTPRETAVIPLVRALEPFVGTDNAPPPRAIALSRADGQISIRRDRALSVAATASGGDVEPIDVREITSLALQGHEGFAAFRYHQQPVELQLQASKFEIQNVIETVVSKGLTEVVLDRSGTSLVRVRYITRSSERQRLRIDLPSGIEPLGADLDGKAIPLEKNPDARPSSGWDAYFINVARTKSSDETFRLTLQYRLSLTPPPFQTRGGPLRLRLPVLGGTESAVPVQQMRVAVWVPDEFALVGTPNHFDRLQWPTWGELLRRGYSRTSTDDCERWIGSGPGGVFDFPTEGHAYVYTNLGGRPQIELYWWHLPFYTWIVSGALVLIALILRNTSWENKLSLVILAIFAASAYALRDADLVLHGLAVATYGLIAMLALWVVRGVFAAMNARPRKTPPSASLTPVAAVIPPPGIFDSITLGMKE